MVSGSGIPNDWGGEDAVAAMGHHAILIQPQPYTIDNAQPIYDILTKLYTARAVASEE